MQYADTNFLVAAHFRSPERSPAVERHLRRLRVPVLVSELAAFEARAVFSRIEGHLDGPGWRRLVSRLEQGTAWRHSPIPWTAVLHRGNELLEHFAPRLFPGSLDTLHVAAALQAGCSTFLSFDSNSNARVLAASARLAVWPELSPAERARVIR